MGINEFETSLQPENNLLKDEKDDFVSDWNSILNRCKNSLSY
jgi:hypothetical protein